LNTSSLSCGAWRAKDAITSTMNSATVAKREWRVTCASLWTCSGTRK